MAYRLARFILLLYLKIFNRWQIEGSENIPTSGPAVLAGNHTSYWDPVVMSCSVQRTVHYIAKDELFHVPVLKWILPHLGCFPVKRGRIDRGALKTASLYLEKGEILGIFPEGTRSKTGEMLPFQPGAALFALRSAAPLVPVGISGSKTIFPASWRGKIKIKIGRPLIYPELYNSKIGEEQLRKVTEDLREEISRLR